MISEGYSMHTKAPHIELLAPAGNATALHAAVTAGADAVYLGLEMFNARRGADNFTVETLREACEYAHMRGVKIYVTLNTVVLPEEVRDALEMARQAWRAGADAFIVQDIGIAAELTRTLPQARLHISTQMNTHNTAGVVAAAALGAKRVTLAREMSIPEIASLAETAAELGMEIETFAHGALCVCYSGQCLMSSMIGGRSANRGTCAQPCRLPYELINKGRDRALKSPGEHLLSPKDLCSIDLLPQMVQAGVTSFKIEGRMKSPDYVSAVVGVYRAVLDRVVAELARAEEAGEDPRRYVMMATDDERQVLAEAFSRGFTTAYLTGDRDNEIMSYQRPNNRGIFIGRVGKATAGNCYIEAAKPLSAGDVIEIWTGKGRSTHVLNEIEMARDGRVRVQLDKSNRSDKAVREGDRVFRVRSVEAAYDDNALDPRIPVQGQVVLQIGQPARMSFACSAVPRGAGQKPLPETILGYVEGPEVEAARTKAITEQDVREHVDRLGQMPFVLESLDVVLDEGVGMGFSLLHKLRTQALEDLQEKLLGSEERKLSRTPDAQPLPAKETRGCQVAAIATNPACARAAKRAGADIIYVPAANYKRGEAMMAGQKTSGAEQAGYPSKCLVMLPNIDHDPIGDAREAQVTADPWDYVKEEKRVLADSLGSALRALDMDAQLHIGPHLPITNKLSLNQAARMGAELVWLSPELTLSQIKELSAGGAPVALGYTVLGWQELMVAEHCFLMSQGPCNQDCANCARRRSPHVLKDRKGFEFPVSTDAFGRSHLYNSVQTDVANNAPELIAAGISAFLVGATLMTPAQTAQAVGRVVRARDLALTDGNTVAKIGASTSGHLFRGVE